MKARRFPPSVAAGVGVWWLYTLLTVGIQWSSGIAYAEWFKTAAAAWRTGVLSLAAGVALLVVLARVLRWDHVWRDPLRLPASTAMKSAMAFWWASIALRAVGIEWVRVPTDLLLAIVASGVLVGVAEELLFRGLFLRGMRAGGRGEAAAAIGTAAAFGLFHLPNVFMGTGAIGLVQIVLAGASGLVLYAFRRQHGTLWPAMLAHGSWDISTFLAGGYARPWLGELTLWMLLGSLVLAIGVLVSIVRQDRHRVALPQA